MVKEEFTFSPEEIPTSSKKESKYMKLLKEVIDSPASSGRIGIPSGIKIETAYNGFKSVIKSNYPDKGFSIHKRGENLYIKK